jgi:inosine-uridine nucleoside N-ribohydrolase
VDVELAGKFTTGETVVDLWNYQGLEGEAAEDWSEGKNCMLAQSVDVRVSNFNSSLYPSIILSFLHWFIFGSSLRLPN